MTIYSKYIEVAIALPIYNTFTYSVPKDLADFISVGKRVLVPFRNRRVTGYILGSCGNVNQREIKSIIDVLDEKSLFPSTMIPFFRWIAEYYFHPMGDVINCALPGGLNHYDISTLTITEEGKNVHAANSVTSIENEILSRLKFGSCRLKDLPKYLHKDIPNSLIYAMECKRWIVQKRELKVGRTKPRMERYVSLIRSDTHIYNLTLPRKKIIDAVKSKGEISVRELKRLVPTAPRLFKSLEKAGLISVYKKKVYRDPFGEPIEPDNVPLLTKEQKNAISTVISALGKGFATFLLAGVTGSGKTEVYMQIAAEAIKGGHSVLVLVPEIALISQMERWFRARFGERIAVLHSGLSSGERYDQWMRILRKEVVIAIGARSAIFAPFTDIGIIIVDEEHDTSYKQESGLRYNARDLAVMRAKLHHGITLLGSATPSIQSYYNVKTKKFIEVNLKKRVKERLLPDITIVDLCKNRDVRGIKRYITSELYGAMKETIDRGEQILLFLNRRGFAGLPICAACGEAVRCKNCDISMTLHKKANAYKCHYCGFTRASVSNCMVCGSSKIKLLGLGTEKVESAVKSLFPDAKVARMDRDTTTRKGSILKILKDLRNHTIDILVGTQMVTKGHDFPNITLVGIICADLSLSFPDFRAGERTFQLLAQVSGRAGRGVAPGSVILQTYNPNHFSISSAKEQDFKTFYDIEISFRKALNYPPFSRMIQFKISGKDEEKTEQHAKTMGGLCNALNKNSQSLLKSVDILGPVKSPLSKIAKQYRWQLLLKCSNVTPLHQFVYRLLHKNPSIFNKRDVKVVIDVDPFSLM